MTAREKQAIVDALMGHCYEVVEPHVLQMMADLSWKDVKMIEPVVEQMLRDAEARGRFEAYLEIAEAREREARVIAKFDRRAMDETLTPF